MFTTDQQFTILPLQWQETSANFSTQRLVAKSLSNYITITKSVFTNSYDVDLHTQVNSWNLYLGVESIEDAKELAWEEHCKQLRNCLLPVDLFHQSELL